jgi:hypothetical protein
VVVVVETHAGVLVGPACMHSKDRFFFRSLLFFFLLFFFAVLIFASIILPFCFLVQQEEEGVLPDCFYYDVFSPFFFF